MYVHPELQDGSLRVGTMRERVGGGGREMDRQTDRDGSEAALAAGGFLPRQQGALH